MIRLAVVEDNPDNRLLVSAILEDEFEIEEQARCLGSRDFREAMAAWMQKREGHYEGR